MADDPRAPFAPAPTKKTYVLEPTPAAPIDAPRPMVPAAVGGRPSARPPREPAPWRKRSGLVVIAVLGAALGAAIAAVLLLPGYVRRKCIEAAAQQGVVLTVDEVHVGAGRFVLTNVTASSPEMPKMSAKATEVEIEMSGLDVARVVARSGEIAIDGSYEGVKRSLDAWQRAHLASAGTGAAAPRFVVEAMHVVWTRPFGDEGRIDALETRAEIARRGAEAHLSTPHAVLTTSAGAFGPWRVSYDRDTGTMRARVAFDPELTDGPAAIMVGDAERVTTLDVDIARTPLAALGIPPAAAAALGLRGSEQIQATVRYRHTTAVRIEARADVALFGLRVSSVPMPLDAKLELAATGDPSNAVEMKKGVLAIGPLRGAVTGTVRVFEDGARIDLAWNAGPIACASLVTLPAEPPGMPPPLPDITAEVQQFLQATGIAKITGDVRMSGALTFDSRDLGQTRAVLSPRATCNVALFGNP